MSRWKALPAELHPRVQQLVVRLRRLKDHSGLSMRQLAAKTGYSPKSWERYLAGRSLPPRDAVEAMARICGDDPVRVLALHEVAADVWEEGRGGAPASDTAAPEPGMFSAKAENARFSRRSPRVALVAGLVVLVLAIASVVLLVTHDKDGKATAASTASATQSQPTYTCHVERIGPARFRYVVEPPIPMPDTGDRLADIAETTRRINQHLERWITAHPEQWLWLHRRWPKEAE